MDFYNIVISEAQEMIMQGLSHDEIADNISNLYPTADYRIIDEAVWDAIEHFGA